MVLYLCSIRYRRYGGVSSLNVNVNYVRKWLTGQNNGSVSGVYLKGATVTNLFTYINIAVAC